jgi:acyl carrier protein
MDKDTVFVKVSDLIRSVLLQKNLKIEPDNSLSDDLGMDSLGAVELINAVEDEYQIAVTEEEMQAIKTVNDAVDLILKKTNHA